MEMKRPTFVKNVNELPWRSAGYPDTQPGELFRERKRLSSETGATYQGVNYSRIPPGGISARYHSHKTVEEFLFILDGEATLRVGDDRIKVTVGDAITLLPESGAHQLVNESTCDCVYLEVGVRDPDDVVEYPEHGYRKLSDSRRESLE